MKAYDYLVLGGGVAAGFATQEFADHQLDGAKIGIVTADVLTPYDRPPLSKGFLAGEKNTNDIILNEPSFYQKHGIEIATKQLITSVNFETKILGSQAGEEFGFKKLIIATGSTPRRMQVAGADLDGIHYLRLIRDAEAIQAEMEKGRRAVIIGAGFIAMEVASVLARKGAEATVVFPGERVWSSFFTPEMSSFFEGYFAERGVRFVRGEKVTAFEGAKRITSVRLQSGRQLPADFVVAGIGAVPSVALFENSALQLGDGIVVNEYLETSVRDVWAAGDVTNFPDLVFHKRRRIEHWDNAVAQGRLAVRNLLGNHEPFHYVPYFFSDVFELSYEFWGDTAGQDQVVYRGNMSQNSFSTWWLSNSRLIAAFVLNRPEEERRLAPKWIREGARVDPKVLQDEQASLALPVSHASAA